MAYPSISHNQRMVDAIRAILGLGPLYASEACSLEIRLARAMSGGFTDGNSMRSQRGDRTHGGNSVVRSL